MTKQSKQFETNKKVENVDTTRTTTEDTEMVEEDQEELPDFGTDEE